MVAKEIFRLAFIQAGRDSYNSGGDTHGEFGDISSFEDSKRSFIGISEVECRKS